MAAFHLVTPCCNLSRSTRTLRQTFACLETSAAGGVRPLWRRGARRVGASRARSPLHSGARWQPKRPRPSQRCGVSVTSTVLPARSNSARTGRPSQPDSSAATAARPTAAAPAPPPAGALAPPNLCACPWDDTCALWARFHPRGRPALPTPRHVHVTVRSRCREAGCGKHHSSAALHTCTAGRRPSVPPEQQVSRPPPRQ